MRFRGRLIVSCFLLSLFGSRLPGEECGADCVHPEKACVCVLDAQGSKIEWTPVGGIEHKPLQLRQALEIGDELSNSNASAIVELTCPGGSNLKLHGQFRAVIMPGDAGQDCAFNLLAGNADLLTENTTQITSGETVMGSKRTQYGMRVSRAEEGVQIECVVFEGEAEVSNRNRRWRRNLESSEKAVWKRGVVVEDIRPVSTDEIKAAAILYSRVDVARATERGIQVSDPKALQASLEMSYIRVLEKPKDPAPRIELAALQTVALSPKQALYHLNRAETFGSSDPEEKTAIAMTKWVAFKQIGLDKEAEGESEKVRKLDPERYKQLQQADPKRIDLRIYKPVPRASGQVGLGEKQEDSTSRLPADTRVQPRTQVQSNTQAQPQTQVEPRTQIPQTRLPTQTQVQRKSPTLQQESIRNPPSLAPILVGARAQPASIAAGSLTTIYVTATTHDGKPLSGAKVTLSADGGVFRATRKTQSEGSTDARGAFQDAWACKPCASAHRISVEVSKAGFSTGKADVDVKIP